MKLFFYGSLLRGLHNYFRFQSGMKFIREANLIGNYSLFTYRGQSYPYLAEYVEEQNSEQFRTPEIKGEIFEVDEQTAQIIDMMERGAGYEKKLTPFTNTYVYVRKNLPDLINVIFVTKNKFGEYDWKNFVKTNKDLKEYAKRYKLVTRNYYNIRNKLGQFCKKIRLNQKK